MAKNLNTVLEPDFDGDIDQMLVILREQDEKLTLTPEQLRNFLGNFIKVVEKKEAAANGITIVFPENFMIQKTNVGGYAIRDILRNMIKTLDHYEPPILRSGLEGSEIEVSLEGLGNADEVPAWLYGHENLIWRGASKNPLWKVEAKTYDDQIKISYRRGNEELRLGKSKFEQSREIKDVRHVFERKEWQVIEPVIEDYLKFKEAQDKNPAGVSRETKKEILAILKEEQAWRKGNSKETQKLL